MGMLEASDRREEDQQSESPMSECQRRAANDAAWDGIQVGNEGAAAVDSSRLAEPQSDQPRLQDSTADDINGPHPAADRSMNADEPVGLWNRSDDQTPAPKTLYENNIVRAHDDATPSQANRGDGSIDPGEHAPVTDMTMDRDSRKYTHGDELRTPSATGLTAENLTVRDTSIPKDIDEERYAPPEADRSPGATVDSAAPSETQGVANLDEFPLIDLHDFQPDGEHGSVVYKVELLDAGSFYLKPADDEAVGLRGDAIPDGQGWAREVAAYEFDRMAGFGLVPETVIRSEPQLYIEKASLQAEAPIEALERDAYCDTDRQRLAVLDYVLGNTDRHPDNYRTQHDGRIAAIDHGLCLPENDSQAIRSQFVAEWMSHDLDTAVLSEVQSVNPAEFASMLRGHQISEAAVMGAIDRLQEVQSNAKITGARWHGEIWYFPDDFDFCLTLLRGRIT